jgi:hypothetical protein
MEAVAAALKASGASRVLDLGCGEDGTTRSGTGSGKQKKAAAGAKSPLRPRNGIGLN